MYLFARIYFLILLALPTICFSSSYSISFSTDKDLGLEYNLNNNQFGFIVGFSDSNKNEVYLHDNASKVTLNKENKTFGIFYKKYNIIKKEAKFFYEFDYKYSKYSNDKIASNAGGSQNLNATGLNNIIYNPYAGLDYSPNYELTESVFSLYIGFEYLIRKNISLDGKLGLDYKKYNKVEELSGTPYSYRLKNSDSESEPSGKISIRYYF